MRAAAPAPAAPAVPEQATATAGPDAASDAVLNALFRRRFGLGPQVDLALASTGTVDARDIIEHRRLAMEVERTPGVHLPGEALGSIRRHAGLSRAA